MDTKLFSDGFAAKRTAKMLVPALALVLGGVLALAGGAPLNALGGREGQSKEPVTARVSTLANVLEDLPANSAENPYTITLTSNNINANWGAINNAVFSAGKYVILDLSACSASGGTIESYSLPSNDDNCIKDNDYLKGLILPDSLKNIGGGAFSDCTGLTSVTTGNSVTSIGGGAFSGCTGLTSVTIGNSVTSIGGGAFSDCTGLTSVTIGNSVTSIGGYAFSGCTGLTSVTIGNSVTSIGDGAFINCIYLANIDIPTSVESIGNQAFGNCASLAAVTVRRFGGKPQITSIGSSAFFSRYRNSALTHIYVPRDGVTAYKAAQGWSDYAASISAIPE
ncbi:MAG: leucine-rich repeat domain-containing protein [Treponema sp.]|jgi:hypothetical protein|nr:leucine-rich repeat domain-containing protein [Treponema sp.]